MMNTANIVNRKSLIVMLLTIYGLLLTPFAVHAAFEDTGTGARPTVMGGTYVAAGDDVQSLMYNPAGLAQLHTHELTSEYSRLYTGLTDGSSIGQYFLGYGQPIKYGGTLAIGWKQLSLDNLYTERTLSLGYGEWITSRIAAGIAVKQLHHEFGVPSMSVDDNGNITNQSPSFFAQYGNASTAYSSDLGVLYRYTDRDTIGLSIQDINEPNVALNPNDHEIVPRTVRAGISHQGRRGLTLAGSLTSREGLSNEQDYTWTGAIEKWWDLKDQGMVAARGSLATGSRSFQQMAMGSSYRYSQYQVDYAFVFNISGVSLGATSGTHRFSFSYRFGPNSPEHVRVQDKTQENPAPKPAAAAAPAQPKTPSQAQPRGSVDEIPELENAPKTQPEPVAGQAIERPTRANPTVEVPEAPVSETVETAQMMQKTPKVVPAPAPEQGPGLQVQVPAPVTPTTAGEGAPVGPSDMEVPVQPTQPSAAAATPITRTQLLEATVDMVGTYIHRTKGHASAENRLSAFAPLYPTLKGYALTQNGEMLEQVDSGDEMDRSAKAYDAMKWNGASAQERLSHLTHDLESTLVEALRDRVWDMNDLRDRKYKAWLTEALAKGHQMTADGVSANARMIYWGQVAKKALEFERMPSQPVPVTAPTPVKKPVPVKKPTKVKQPITELESTPAAKTPVKATEKAANRTEEKALERSLGDGEWLYRVHDGDTLLSLANRFYGDYNRWRDIYVLNQDRLGRGGSLRAGQLLVMPKKVGK